MCWFIISLFLLLCLVLANPLLSICLLFVVIIFFIVMMVKHKDEPLKYQDYTNEELEGNEPMKKCRNCKEEIKDAARVCPYCQTRFGF